MLPMKTTTQPTAATTTSNVTLPRVRTTAAQRATLLCLLDPGSFPLKSNRHGNAHPLERMGFATYNTARDAAGNMKGWTLTPAGKEKAEAIRAVLRAAAA